MSQLPDRIEKVAAAFRHDDPLSGLAERLPQQRVLAQNDSGIAFVPPWARYPFEVSTVPHQRVR